MRNFLSVIICVFCMTTAAFAGAKDAKMLDCASHGKLECVKTLINSGEADINAKDNGGETVLMWAVGFGGGKDVVKYLVERGADINAKDNDGWTALMEAASFEYQDIVEYLVEHGADIDAKDNDGWTALMWGAWNGHKDIVEYLVEHGADIDAKDNDGKTALDIAKSKKHTDIVDYMTERTVAGIATKAFDEQTAAAVKAATEYTAAAEKAAKNAAEQAIAERTATAEKAAKAVAEKTAAERTDKIKEIVNDIKGKDFERSHWKTASGKFNGARLASDSIAGVVLGTAGGLITSSVIKKNQTKHGFENLKCTVNGQFVSEYGDEFTVGLQQ